jgi:hypothetical protein
MTTESACPGQCNRHYREAREKFNQDLADYDPLDADQSRPIPPDIQPWPGNPWCGRCRSRIRETLAQLDILASLLAATADGHRAGPGTERISGTAVALSPSAAGDDLDELITMLAGWEEAYRDHKDLGPTLAPRGHLAAPETELIAWLNRRLDEILTAPFAVEFGQEVMQWHREFTNKTKAGQRTLRKPLRCPRCHMLLLTWTEGDSHVACGNPDCQLRIPLAEYEMEVDRRGSALERGEFEQEVA